MAPETRWWYLKWDLGVFSPPVNHLLIITAGTMFRSPPPAQKRDHYHHHHNPQHNHLALIMILMIIMIMIIRMMMIISSTITSLSNFHWAQGGRGPSLYASQETHAAQEQILPLTQLIVIIIFYRFSYPRASLSPKDWAFLWQQEIWQQQQPDWTQLNVECFFVDAHLQNILVQRCLCQERNSKLDPKSAPEVTYFR